MRGSCRKRRVNRLQDFIKVAQNLVVREPQDVPSLNDKPIIADGIACWTVAGCMPLAINFDDQLRSYDSVVQDVSPARNLTPELRPAEPAATERRPELPLR